MEQRRRVANGKYDMGRSFFDCESRQLETYQFMYYQSDWTNNSDFIDRRILRLSDVKPNSVGKAGLESLCMLYGSIVLYRFGPVKS